MTAVQEWWRPASEAGPKAHSLSSSQSSLRSSPLAFGALILFTAILLLAPQAHFLILAPLRIALWTALLASTAYIFDRILHHRPLTILTREIVFTACLLGWAVLTIPLSLWPGGSVEVIQDQYLKSLLIFWLLSNVVTSLRAFRRIAWALSLMSIPLSLTGVNNYFTGTFLQYDAPVERIRGYESALTANPNDLALMLNLILPLSVALLLSERRTFRRALLLFALASSVTAVVLTFSRAGFVTLASVGLMYLWHFKRRPERHWVCVALLLALVCIPLLPGTYGERIASITNVNADPTGSAEARWRDMVAALSFIMKHPIVGAGIGSDQLALNAERGSAWSSVHNVYLQYAVDLGIPGLVLFLLLLFGCLCRLRKIRAAAVASGRDTELFCLAEGMTVTLHAFGVAALFHPVAYNFYFYYLAGLALGLSSAAGTQRGEDTASPRSLAKPTARARIKGRLRIPRQT